MIHNLPQDIEDSLTYCTIGKLNKLLFGTKIADIGKRVMPF